MAGSIRQRLDRGPNTWQLRVYAGRDSDGRVRHQCCYFQGTQHAAEKEPDRLVLAQAASPEVVPDEASRRWGPIITINHAISGWKANGWDDLSPVTSSRYEDILRLYMRGFFGTRKIAALSPYDVERYFRLCARSIFSPRGRTRAVDPE